MKSISMQHKERGAVSIFSVIFAALLITVVTVSFIRIMINDQNQATNNDLSQSAYDSALAGVEDAKRALLRYVDICNNGAPADCAALATNLSTDECNQAVRIGDVVDPNSVAPVEGGSGEQVGEIRIQQSTSVNDEVLDQAYTCVTIDLQTPDYLGTISAGQSKIIPLKGITEDRASSTIDRVTVEWYSREDLGSESASGVVDPADLPAPRPFLSQDSWPENRPSVLRTQFMQIGNEFRLSDFDITTGGQSNGNTVFLWPTEGAAAATAAFTTLDPRKANATADTPPDSSASSPYAVRCETVITGGGYACSMTLILPEPIGGSADDRTAFLRLTPFYNATHFRVTLQNGSADLSFDGVQPEIDSTGRANDLFRRVASRVDLIDTNFPFPDAALDVEGDLCKNFAVTDQAYIAGPACTP